MFKIDYLKAYIFLIVTLLLCNPIFSQTKNFVIPDSLKDFSYGQLYNSTIKFYNDTIKSKIYLNTYLQKGVNENNLYAKALGLTYLSNYITNSNEKIDLLNQAIALEKEGNIKDVLAVTYSFKGNYFLDKGDFNMALENYLHALRIAEEIDYQEFAYITKHNIAIIKADIGKNKEALSLFKECYDYEKSSGSTSLEDYYTGTFYLSEAYLRSEKIDSAYPFIKEGLNKTKDTLQDLFYKFKLNKGIYFLKKGQLDSSRIYLKSAVDNLPNNSYNNRVILLTNYYLGELHAIDKAYNKSENYFLKVDSIVQTENMAMPEVRPGFEYLVYYARRSNDKDKQLNYINKLLKFDSIVNSNKGAVGDKLFKEFDTPQLVNQKEQLIDQLTADKKTVSIKFYLTLILSIITAIVLIFQYNKRRQYKIKFNALLNKNDITKPQKHVVSEYKSIEQLDLKTEIVEDILNQLEKFENRNGFLKKKMSRSSLAKELGTNTKYLSKVINASKNKSFTNYINDLRIEYCIKSLKEDSKMRQYTIQGIAEEVGFNNAESFSMAFKKATGLKPSYFIKKLSKKIG